MIPDVNTFLISQGVLGVAVLVLGFVVAKLYSKTERLEKEKSDLMEARRLDSIETLKQVTEVMQTNSQTNRLLAEKIEAGKRESAGVR